MKKLLILVLGLVLLLSLASCSKGDDGEDAPDVPPGFTVLQKQQKLTKHSEKGEAASFSESEFLNFLGEEMSYITVTALPENGTLMCNGSSVLKGQTIPADQLEFMKFIPQEGCKSASFDFTCDSKGYHGKDITCSIVFSDEVNTAPVVSDSAMATVEGISCHGKLSIREPNGDDYTVNVITYPTDGYVSVTASGEIVYTPESGFCGRDKLVYSVTDCFGEVSETATVKIQVDKNPNGICFADMKDNPIHLDAYKMCNENVMVYRYENGEYYFDPDAPVSKMDFLVMVMCVSGKDSDVTAVADSIADDDSGLSSGLMGYLTQAYESGLIKLENGKFSPKSNITIADAAFMVSKALDLPFVGSNMVSADGASQYNAIEASVSAGIFDMDFEAIDSNATLTKSDAARLLNRMAEYMQENNIQK